MNDRHFIRLVCLYYWLVTGYVVWSAILLPIYELATLPAAQSNIIVLGLLIPTLIFVCLLALAGYSLRNYSEHSYGIAVLAQLGLIALSLPLMLFAFWFGLINCIVNSVLLILLVRRFEDPTKLLQASQVRAIQEGKNTRLIRNTLITVVVGCVFLLLLWCFLSEYTVQTMSAPVLMGRIAGVPTDETDIEVIRESLLEQLPPGTKDTAVIAFLEAHNVPQDRFVGGQFARYQRNQSDILALFSTPPWVLNVFCSQVHYGIRFTLNGQGELSDIFVEDYVRCW